MDACNAQKINFMEMAMYNEHNDLLSSSNQETKKRSRLVLFAGVVLVFCGVTALLCHTFYSSQKNDILATQKERLQLTTEATIESIRLWGVSLDNQARRVSESELYRLFAQDIAAVDEQKSGMLNESGAISILDEDMAFLAEQIPMMRNILLDFMSYNGLHDARLVSPDGKTLLSSIARPTPLQEEQVLAVRRAAATNKTTYAPVRASSTGLILDYATPLLPASVSDETAKPVGAFLLSVPVTGQIANFTSSGTSVHREIKSNILHYDGKQWETVLPNSTEAVPSSIKIDANAASVPFGKRESLSGKSEVYSIGMIVPNIGWIVIEELPAHIVEEQLNRAFNLIYGAGTFLCLSVLLMLALVWWIMIGREQRSVAQKFRKLYQLIRQQKHLLDSINISLDVGLMMVDVSGKLHLVNRAFALIVDKTEETLQGKNLHDIVPDNVALQVQEAVANVSKSDESKTIEITLPLKGEDRLFRATLFPFEDKDEDDSTSAAVITMQDITEFRRSSEKRNKQQMSTIEALVSTIERVDPYLAGHSTLMRRLAELLSENMGLDAKDRDTLTTAAVLSQIGRIFVPRDLLSKTDKLTPEEQAEIAKIPEYAYDILKTINFDNPVPAAVVQMNEKLDGSGSPNQLKDDAISLHGRILGIINTFCAMASPRAFRAGLPIDVALSILRKDTKSYDQNIVECLATVLMSQQGAEAIAARLAEVTEEK